MGGHLAAIKAKIDEAQVVSFDIFDTALLRGVEQPVDLFLLLGFEGGLLDPHDFAKARIHAERIARQKARDQRGVFEVSLDEIYEGLEAHPSCVPESLPSLLEKERELELRVSRPNPFICEAYQYAVSLKKKVGFISDIYLDRPLIESMLAKGGFDGYSFLMLSSETGATKALGSLFLKTLAHLDVDPKDLLHIGDNAASDGHKARALGIKTHLIPKAIEMLPQTQVGKRFSKEGVSPLRWSEASFPKRSDQGIWTSLWRGLVAGRAIHSSDDFFFELGYQYLGILLLGFGLWLESEAIKARVSRLYFLARDGHIMLKVHEMLRDQGLAETPGDYFYASRRALNLPALTEINESALDFLVSGRSTLSVSDFLSRVGSDPSSLLEVIKAHGFLDGEEKVQGAESYRRLKSLFKQLAPELLERAEKERQVFEDYCTQEGVFETESPGVVDIGWHGSLQASFSWLLHHYGDKKAIEGFYLGTYKMKGPQNLRQHAYLFQGGEPQGLLKTVRASVEIFEWFFSAPHGSVLGYKREPDGSIAPVLESLDEDIMRTLTASKVQAGALVFIDDALGLLPKNQTLPLVDPKLSVALIHGLLQKPKNEEAKILGELMHAEGFGGVHQVLSIASPKGHVLKPWEWKDILLGYRASYWRRGYLKRLGLPLFI